MTIDYWRLTIDYWRLTIDYWRLTFDLYIDVEKLWGGWVVDLDYSVSSGPFLRYEIEIGDGPGPELDNLQC